MRMPRRRGKPEAQLVGKRRGYSRPLRSKRRKCADGAAKLQGQGPVERIG